MNAKAAPPRLLAAQVASEGPARVVSVETGLVRVSYRGRTFRATLGADLLALVAADAEQSPQVGDRVMVRTWSDGPVTVERVLARGLPAGPGEEPDRD